MTRLIACLSLALLAAPLLATPPQQIAAKDHSIVLARGGEVLDHDKA